MKTMSKETEFLKIFNDLEKFLTVNYHNHNYSYTGFVKRLYQIRKSKANRFINNNQNFEMIKQSAQIRNIIAHNNNVIVPSDKFLSEFKRIVKKITSPLKIRDVMTNYQDLKTVGLNDSLKDAIELLNKSGFSTIPVIDKDELLGIFTEKSLYDYFSVSKNNSLNKSMVVRDIIDAIDLNNHPRKYYDFISVNQTIYEAYELFNKDLKSRREMLLLLVTENGKIGETLLGIVALRDLENHLID
ncbi:MAG: CBS domain-containing protein [Candidatus Izemoplasmatales bacterium]